MNRAYLKNKSKMAAEFYELNRGGLSLRAIAKKYNISHHTVGNWLDEFGFTVIVWKSNEFKDISNEKFGLITAIKPIGKKPKGNISWLCYCDCDIDKANPLNIDGADLRRGRKTHCGCNNAQKIDISGQKFGYLTAIRDTGKRKNKHVVWETLCVCGKKFDVTYGDLTSGHTKSCSCKKPKGEDHYNFQGGATELTKHLRSVIKEWQRCSLKKWNYKCCITGSIDTPKTLRQLVQVQNLSLENASLIVVSKFREDASMVPNSENSVSLNRSPNELVKELMNHLEQQENFNKQLLERLDQQEKFNKQLVEQLNKQENYIRERMDKRDEMLMEAMRQSQETKMLILAAKEEQKKKKGFFSFFNKN